jgi:hypothetical protein
LNGRIESSILNHHYGLAAPGGHRHETRRMATRFTIGQHAWPFAADQPSRLSLLVIAVMLASACSGDRPADSVPLPPTPVVTLRPTWAVVTEPYLRLRALPDDGAPIAGHLRRGDVARIAAIDTVIEQVDGERHYWYRLEGDAVTGWALDNALESYGSEYRARNASERLGGGD